jgi:hypothetical protein
MLRAVHAAGRFLLGLLIFPSHIALGVLRDSWPVRDIVDAYEDGKSR